MLSALSNEPKFYTLDQLISKSIFQSEYYIMDMIEGGLISPIMQDGVMLFTKDTVRLINEEQLKNLA